MYKHLINVVYTMIVFNNIIWSCGINETLNDNFGEYGIKII